MSSHPSPLPPQLNQHLHWYRRTEFKVALSVGLAFFVLLLGFWFATIEQGDTTQTATQATNPAAEPAAPITEDNNPAAEPEDEAVPATEDNNPRDEPETTEAASPPGPKKLDASILFDTDIEDSFADGSMSTVEYKSILWCSNQGPFAESFAEFRLDKKYSRLTGTIGASDLNKTDADPVSLTIKDESTADSAGNISYLYQRDFNVGETDQLDIDVSQSLRLRVQCSGQADNWVGIDAVLTP